MWSYFEFSVRCLNFNLPQVKSVKSVNTLNGENQRKIQSIKDFKPTEKSANQKNWHI